MSIKIPNNKIKTILFLVAVISLLVLLIYVFLLVFKHKDSNTSVKAYNLTPKQMSYKNHVKKLNEYSSKENVIAYENNDNTNTIYVFSSPIEYYNNEIDDLREEAYQCFSIFSNKNFPEKLSNKSSLEISKSQNFINIMPTGNNTYKSKKRNVPMFLERKDKQLYMKMYLVKELIVFAILLALVSIVKLNYPNIKDKILLI